MLGLLKGLAVTWKNMFSKKITDQYPDERPFLDHRWRGSFQLDKEACICCSMCVNACPNKAIFLEAAKGEGNKRVLRRYLIHFERCLVCGLCVEACPQGCLRFTREFELACYTRDEILLDLVKKPNLQAPASKYGLKTKPGSEEG